MMKKLMIYLFICIELSASSFTSCNELIKYSYEQGDEGGYVICDNGEMYNYQNEKTLGYKALNTKQLLKLKEKIDSIKNIKMTSFGSSAWHSSLGDSLSLPNKTILVYKNSKVETKEEELIHDFLKFLNSEEIQKFVQNHQLNISLTFSPDRSSSLKDCKEDFFINEFYIFITHSWEMIIIHSNLETKTKVFRRKLNKNEINNIKMYSKDQIELNYFWKLPSLHDDITVVMNLFLVNKTFVFGWNDINSIHFNQRFQYLNGKVAKKKDVVGLKEFINFITMSFPSFDQINQKHYCK